MVVVGGESACWGHVAKIVGAVGEWGGHGDVLGGGVAFFEDFVDLDYGLGFEEGFVLEGDEDLEVGR